MKHITLLNRFFKGIRLSALVLSVVMLLALTMCVMVYINAELESAQLQALSSPREENVELFQFFRNTADSNPNMNEILPQLAADARVKQVYTILEPKTVFYGKKSINLLLYTPEMVEMLPGLKRLGVDFKKNPNGCVIIGYEDIMGDLRKGDELVVRTASKDNIRIPIVGRETEKQHLELQNSTNPVRINYILQDGDVVIMLATEQVMEQIVAHTSRQLYHRNFFVEYQDGVTPAQREDVLKTAAPQFQPTSLESVRKIAGRALIANLGEKLPLPLFLLCASLMAYFSIVILTFKRREKDLAMFYLCGGSRATCAGITFATFSIISLIPIVLTTAAIICWKEFDLSTEIYSAYSDYEAEALRNGTHFTKLRELYPGLKGFLIDAFGSALSDTMLEIRTFKMNTSCLWIVFGFYGITMLVAALVTWLSMRKHSPLTYLRGVNE